MATRIYADQALTTGMACALPEAAARHLLQVLRLKVGDGLILFNGQGGEYEAHIEQAGKREVIARVGSFRNVSRESPLRVTLAQCVSKGERMDYTLQKAVELGVTGVQPLLSARSVVRVDEERWEKKLEHWRGVIVAACEQSGRTRLPVLHPIHGLRDWLAGDARSSVKLTLAPGAAGTLATLSAPKGKMEHVVVLVGPEGGLSAEELATAQRAGFIALRLGPRVLRTETAGVALIAAIQAMWGDLR